MSAANCRSDDLQVARLIPLFNLAPRLCPRPTEFLISDCWNDDPSLRPTFEVVVNRLRMMLSQQRSFRRKLPSAQRDSVDDLLQSNKGMEEKEKKSDEMCVSL